LLGEREHAVADLQAGDVGAKCTDNAGRKLARREWALGEELVLASNDETVDEIHRRRLNGDHDLARSGLGIRQLADRMGADRSKLPYDGGAHGFRSVGESDYPIFSTIALTAQQNSVRVHVETVKLCQT
jgi:hypothetical protein